MQELAWVQEQFALLQDGLRLLLVDLPPFLGELAGQLRTSHFFGFLEIVAHFVVPFGILRWLLEASGRKQERHYRAWELINSARDHPATAGA